MPTHPVPIRPGTLFGASDDKIKHRDSKKRNNGVAPGKPPIGGLEYPQEQHRRDFPGSSSLRRHSSLPELAHRPSGEGNRPKPVMPAQPVTFKQLWEGYPWGDPSKNSADTDQCAIRLSVALHKAGIDMSSFSSDLVKPRYGQSSIGRELLDGKVIATRANELGEWLDIIQNSNRPIVGIGKTENITGSNWESKIKGRTGIVMFDAYWTQGKQTAANATGGHIDLWNISRLTMSSVPDAFSTIGRELGVASFRQGTHIAPNLSYSDLGGARTILFWEVK